jgi:hypothetical protein
VKCFREDEWKIHGSTLIANFEIVNEICAECSILSDIVNDQKIDNSDDSG